MQIGQRLVVFAGEAGEVKNVWVFDGRDMVERVDGVPKNLNLRDGTLQRFIDPMTANHGLVAVPVCGVPHEFDLYPR